MHNLRVLFEEMNKFGVKEGHELDTVVQQQVCKVRTEHV